MLRGGAKITHPMGVGILTFMPPAGIFLAKRSLAGLLFRAPEREETRTDHD